MALRKQLRLEILGNARDIEATITIDDDLLLGCRASVTADVNGEQVSHKTGWVDHERDAIAAASTWVRTVAITGAKRAA
jgi:hypothetical protein